MISKGKEHVHVVLEKTCDGDIDDYIRDGWRDSYMLQSENVMRYVNDPDTVKGSSIISTLGILLDVMKKNNAQSILDVGCNAGYVYDWLVQNYDRPFSYIGIDINADIISEAQQLHDDGPSFMQEDLFNLDTRADVVFCSRVLIHVPDFEKAMRLLYDSCLKAAVITLKIGKESCSRYALVDSGSKKKTGDSWFLRTVSEDRIKALGIPYEICPKSRKYSTVILRRGDV